MRAFPADWFKAAAAVPNIILALGYQMNIFPIFKGMKKAGDSRMTAAIAVSLSVCTFTYLLVGILGYNYVGNTVGANFLNFLSYDKFPKIYYFIIKLSFLISIYFAFPLMFFGSRNNFIALIQLFKLKQKDIEYIKWRQRDEIEHISSYIQED
jgi:amino acid permease